MITLFGMNSTFARRWIAVAVAGGFLACSPLRADDAGPATPEDVHRILREALGDGPDSAPPPGEQRKLVDKALTTLRHVPHVYHGQLMRAAQDLDKALEALSRPDGVNVARGDILDADELLRSIM